jgi:hypothetical protein
MTSTCNHSDKQKAMKTKVPSAVIMVSWYAVTAHRIIFQK